MNISILGRLKSHALNEQQIIQNLKDAIGDDAADVGAFFRLAESRKLKKNEYITQQHDFNVPFILVKSGCLMSYHTDRGGDLHVLQFAADMWWTGDLEAFFKDKPSLYSIKAVVDTEVYVLSKKGFDEMLEVSPAFEKYYRILFQNALVSHQKRILRNISYTAEERFKSFKETFPKLELVVAQRYIASYLGITPEFLSKMKRKMK